MQNPRNRQVTEKAENLAVLADRVTAEFPRQEAYGLTAQMRHAAISVGSNIAEGCGRAGDRELATFLHYAYGSAAELEFQLRVAGRLGLGTPVDVASLTEATVELKRMLSRLIVSLRKQRRPPHT